MHANCLLNGITFPLSFFRSGSLTYCGAYSMVSSSSSATTTGAPPRTANVGGGRVPRQSRASRMAGRRGGGGGKWVVICKKAFKRNMNAFLSIGRLINGAIKRVKQTYRTVNKLPTKLLRGPKGNESKKQGPQN